MTTADQLVKAAAKHIGVSGTDNIFNTWIWGKHVYDPDTYPWCAAFQSYIAVKECGMKISPSASAAGVANQGKRIADEQARKGDWVVFNWDGRTDTGWCDHIGLVEWFDHDTQYFGTIEGNCDDCVKRVTRYNDGPYFTAFFRPPYDGKEPDTKPKAPAQPRYRVKGIKKWGQWHSCGESAKSIYGIYDVEFSGLPKGSWWRLTLEDGKALAKNTHNKTGKPLTGVEVYYETEKPTLTGYWEALYRVRALNGPWGKWEHDVEDGGAGGLGVIDVLQFKIAKC